MIDLSGVTWRKSTMSANNGACVEVADLGACVAVRDSKHPDGGALVFDGPAWDDVLAGVNAGAPTSSLAFLDDGRVALCDPTNPEGPVLIYTAFEWACFVDGVGQGEFARG